MRDADSVKALLGEDEGVGADGKVEELVGTAFGDGGGLGDAVGFAGELHLGSDGEGSGGVCHGAGKAAEGLLGVGAGDGEEGCGGQAGTQRKGSVQELFHLASEG